MKFFITGDRGYIGSHLELPHEGCDLKDGQDFVQVKGVSADVLIHLAASVSVPQSLLDPMGYFQNNFLSLIAFLQNNQFRKVIFISTGGAMYGDRLLAKESDANWNDLQSPYAQSKFLAEEYVRHSSPNHVILRLANVFGGNQSIRGESSVHQHFATDDPITVYGGEQSRDFIHVGWVTEAIRKAAQKEIIGTFNIGNGTSMRISDVAEAFSRMRGVPIKRLPREEDVDFVSLDISKAKAAGLL